MRTNKRIFSAVLALVVAVATLCISIPASADSNVFCDWKGEITNAKTEGWSGGHNQNIDGKGLAGAVKVDADGMHVDTAGFTFNSQQMLVEMKLDTDQVKAAIAEAKKGNGRVGFRIYLNGAQTGGGAKCNMDFQVYCFANGVWQDYVDLLCNPIDTGTVGNGYSKYYTCLVSQLRDMVPDTIAVMAKAGDYGSGIKYVNYDITPIQVDTTVPIGYYETLTPPASSVSGTLYCDHYELNEADSLWQGWLDGGKKLYGQASDFLYENGDGSIEIDFDGQTGTKAAQQIQLHYFMNHFRKTKATAAYNEAMAGSHYLYLNIKVNKCVDRNGDDATAGYKFFIGNAANDDDHVVPCPTGETVTVLIDLTRNDRNISDPATADLSHYFKNLDDWYHGISELNVEISPVAVYSGVVPSRTTTTYVPPVTTTPTQKTTTSPIGKLPGDINLDGAVNTLDVRMMLNAIAEGSLDKLSEQQKINGDFNNDGVIDVKDVRALVLSLLG